MEETQQRTLHVLPSSTHFCMRQTVPNGHGSDRDAIWGLNLQRVIFSQHVRTNTQHSAKKHTKARSHCLFVRVSSQKTHTWEPRVAHQSFRNMSVRTRNCQQRSAPDLAHIVFSSSSVRKKPSHMGTSRGNPFWCNAFLAMTTHHMILSSVS